MRRPTHANDEEAAAPAFRSRTYAFVNLAVHISTYHEMARIAVKKVGETLE